MKKLYSLRALQTVYGLAFLLLLLISTVGGLVAFQASEQSSLEAQRVGTLLKTVEVTRGDLYRQLKEVFDYHFLLDEDADVEYKELGRRSQENFTSLQAIAVTNREKVAIQHLIDAYQIVDTRFTEIMSFARGQIPQSERLSLLDTELENEDLSTLEVAFRATEELFLVAQMELESNVRNLVQTSLILLFLPILIAAALLLFARFFLQKAFVKPLADLLDSMKLFGAGNLDHQAVEQGANEMLDLQRAINNMANDLNESRRAVIHNEKQAALGALVPVVAHNIRNPLASIRATAEVSNVSNLNAETQQSFSDIIGAVDQLEKWLLALLNFLNPSNPKFTDCQFQRCVDNALSLINPKVSEKELSIKKDNWDNPVNISLDTNLMEQAIYGLIVNAIDASPRKGKINLRLTSLEDQVQLIIDDEGQGFSFAPEQQEFSRGPTTKRRGSGLGIPFAYKICELHKGSLTFEQRPSAGTRVTISLPLAPSKAMPHG